LVLSILFSITEARQECEERPKSSSGYSKTLKVNLLLLALKYRQMDRVKSTQLLLLSNLLRLHPFITHGYHFENNKTLVRLMYRVNFYIFSN